MEAYFPFGFFVLVLIVILLFRSKGTFKHLPRLPRLRNGLRGSLTNNRGWLLSAAIILAVVTFIFMFVPGYIMVSPLFWALLFLLAGTYIPKVTGTEWHGGVAMALAGLIVLVLFMQTGTWSWIMSAFDTIDRSAQSSSLESDRDITVYSNFILHVPAGSFSETLSNKKDRCLIRRPENNLTASMPPAQVKLTDASPWSSYVPGRPFAKIRYNGRSLTTTYKIQVQIRKSGECNSW